jgi:predicted porin
MFDLHQTVGVQALIAPFGFSVQTVALLALGNRRRHRPTTKLATMIHRYLLLPTLVALFTAGAAAQTVTVFGIVDASVEHVNRVGPAGSGLTRLPSLTGSVPSRIGFRGAEDLGGGLRAVFTLEQGFAPDTGGLSQGGRAFGRQAFVGLSGPWGTVSFGRQYTMLFWSILESDVLGPAIYGTGSLDPYIPNARADNALAWRGSFGGWMLGATYSPGRDAVNAGNPAGTNCPGELASDAKACREASLLVRYDAASWGVAWAQDTIRGGPGAFAGLSSSALSDTRVSVNGYLRFKGAKLSLGLVRRHNDANPVTPRSDLWYLGAVWPLSPALTLDGELLKLSYQGSADQAWLVAARATYALSRRSALYVTVGSVSNEGKLALSVSAGAAGSNPKAGAGQSGITAGLRHAF